MKKLKKSFLIIIAAFFTVSLALTNANIIFAQVTSPDYPGVICEEEEVPMRDGTLLSTEVYHPADPGEYPVMLLRTPYGALSGGGCFKGYGGAMASWAMDGYVGVAQHCRGTFTSQGIFDANVNEAADGYDAVEWAAVQPWSNGKVGMTGQSYMGLTVWQPAMHTPPHLVAIQAGITTADLHKCWLYDNGIFLPWGSIYWVSIAFVPDQIIRTGKAEGLPQSQIDQMLADWRARVANEILTQWVWELPLTSFDVFRPYNQQYYYDWLANPNYRPYWEPMDLETRFADVKVPALINGAWYDPFACGTISSFEGMRAQGGSPIAREGTKLVMAAYGHSGNSGTPSFGMDTSDPTLSKRFFDHYLKGAENGVDQEPPAELYVLVPPDTGNNGSGFWIEGDSYPLPGTNFVKYYLRSGGNANTRVGDGELVAGDDKKDIWGNKGDKKDRFVYDPMDPVPTTGGNYLNGYLKAGAADQSTVELRDDILVYTSAPLKKDLAVIGPVRVKFWAQSSARDTDFTAKLVDVHLDDFPHNVLDRAVRARFREGTKLAPKLIQPGKPYEYTIELGDTATIFRKGHQIRLEISSSNFPRLSRNMNTGAPNPNDDPGMQIAEQTIWHKKSHPSYLELPVVPNVSIPMK